MKSLISAITLAIFTSYPNLSDAAFSFDAGTQILTDSTANRMWLLDGIGFCCSYAFPGFANTWIDGLNQLNYGGHHDWRLPTVAAPSSGDPPPAMSGELGQLFVDLSAAYADRDQWPFSLGQSDYGGRIIYTDAVVPTQPGNYWGLSFGDGAYKQVYVGYAYAWVGVMAVRPIPEPETWAMLVAGCGLVGWRFRKPPGVNRSGD
jgi:hypothetical protein